MMSRENEEAIDLSHVPSLTDTLNTHVRRKQQDSPTPPPQSPVEPQPTAEGFECAIQTLYEGPPKCQCCKNWVEEYPDDLSTQVQKQEEVKQKALVVRMRKSHGEEKSLELDSIVVQNNSLRNTLSEVFSGYIGITAVLKKLTFTAPFRPFYYRRKQFKSILDRQKQEEPSAAAFSQLLWDVVDEELHDVVVEVGDLVDHKVITYRLLWTLFEPGERVMHVSDDKVTFFIVKRCGYGKGGLDVDVKFVEWDGVSFGYNEQTWCIEQFDGTQQITELDLFPAAFHPDREEAEASAISRGRRLQKLQAFHHKSYYGLVTEHRGFLGTQETNKNASGRIIIDAVSYFSERASKPRLSPMGDEAIIPKISVKELPTHKDEYGSVISLDDLSKKKQREWIEYQKSLGVYSEPKTGPTTNLSDEQLLLCTATVRGYSLKLKQWAEFEVDRVEDIKWNDEAIENLILPSGFKNLVLSFVEGQSKHKNVFDDIIEGKGKGIIMMLVGKPGVGKTLTAEAVAEKLRKPLYFLSAGELGRDPDHLESRLEEVMRMCEMWDAILLFDECDVFIQERTTTDLAHNEIVAVFLRLLEYYQGIMFMTSNRADTIDRAFHSRIHLTLHYPDLEASARESIWRQFVSRSQLGNSVADDDFKQLAQLDLNGRQIKNAVKVSTLLASQEEKTLGLEQIQTVLQATRASGQLAWCVGGRRRPSVWSRFRLSFRR